MANKPYGRAVFELHCDNCKLQQLTLTGRTRWALECLMEAGAKGCTPIDTPGPRWSGYTFLLREMGVKIETITEPHGGPFKGHHARYVLRSRVTRLNQAGEAA